MLHLFLDILISLPWHLKHTEVSLKGLWRGYICITQLWTILSVKEGNSSSCHWPLLVPLIVKEIPLSCELRCGRGMIELPQCVKSQIWLAEISVIDLCTWVDLWEVMVWNGHSCSPGMFRSLSGSTALLSFGQTISAHPVPPRDAASSLCLYVYPSMFFDWCDWLHKPSVLQHKAHLSFVTAHFHL